VTPAEAYAYCERLTRQEARNFAYGIRLLEPERRAALSAIYALARRIDDIGDAAPDRLAGPGRDTGPGRDSAPAGGVAAGAPARLADLDAVRHALAHLDDPGDDPVLVALADAARRFPLPLGAFEELLEGCEMDCRGSAYATFDDLVGYCQRVAGSIGRLSLAVFGRRAGTDPADDLGVALQLTNILRDIREDQAMGRVYLPKEDLERFGVSPQLEGERDALVAVVLLLAARARSYYRSGLGLLPALDHRSAACAGAMAGIYRRLLARIETRPEEVFERRVRLSSAEKALVAGRALLLGRA